MAVFILDNSLGRIRRIFLFRLLIRLGINGSFIRINGSDEVKVEDELSVRFIRTNYLSSFECVCKLRQDELN